MSRAGERGKADESGGERAGEYCAGAGELDIAGKDVKRAESARVRGGGYKDCCERGTRK